MNQKIVCDIYIYGHTGNSPGLKFGFILNLNYDYVRKIKASFILVLIGKPIVDFSNYCNTVSLITVVMDITSNIVQTVPATVYYIPNFITESEEECIMKKVYTSPKPKWTQLSHRRLQNWGGIPHSKGMIPEKIPEWLQIYVQKVITLEVFNEKSLPNHVLINEYLPGQGILPHLDGPLFYPTVTTISCGSHTLLDFYQNQNEDDDADNKKGKKVYTLLLERRSLLILRDKMYTEFMHGIDEMHEDHIDQSINNLYCCTGNYKIGDTLVRNNRISLTIRNVPKCSTFKLIFSK